MSALTLGASLTLPLTPEYNIIINRGAQEITIKSRTLGQHESAFLGASRDGFRELSILRSADLKLVPRLNESICSDE